MLDEKIKIAIDRINKAFDKNKRVITGHSGGKDSVVINYLVWLSECTKYATIHNVKPLLGTSNDPVGALTEMHPDTLNFLYTSVCLHNEIVFMHSSNMKEYIDKNSIDCQIDGSRRCEFDRAGKSSMFIANGEMVSREFITDYVENGIFGLNMSYPIFDWSDDDVFELITSRDLPLSDEYIKNGELAAYYAKSH